MTPKRNERSGGNYSSATNNINATDGLLLVLAFHGLVIFLIPVIFHLPTPYNSLNGVTFPAALDNTSGYALTTIIEFTIWAA